MRCTCRLTVAIAAALLTGISGCGDDDSPGGEASGEVIRIGASFTLSGPGAFDFGTAPLERPFEEVNEAGGIEIDGERRRVELIVRDNRSSSSTLSQQLRNLVLEDDVSALIGPGGGLAIPAAGVANALKVPMLVTGLPVELFADATEGKSRYAWDTFTGLPVETFDVVDLARTNKKVAAMAGNDPQGQPFLDLMTRQGAERGYDVVASTLVPAGTTDFSSFIREAISAGGEVLVTALAPADGIALWKQMKALGYSPKVAACYLCGANPGWADLGDLGNGAFTLAAWTRTAGLPETERIIEEFGDEMSDADLNVAATEYHLARILLDAIARAGSADPEAINQAIAETDGDFPLGRVQFQPGGTSRQTTYYVQWQDGDMVQVFPAEGAEELEAPVQGLR